MGKKKLQILCGNLDDWEAGWRGLGPPSRSGYHQNLENFIEIFKNILKCFIHILTHIFHFFFF